MNSNIGILGIVFSGAVLVIYSLLGNYRDRLFSETLISSIAVTAIGIFIWIKKNITLYYKEFLKEDSIKQLEDELAGERKRYEELFDEHLKLAMVNHKYSSRISSVERHVQNLTSKLNMDVEFSAELSDTTALVKDLSKDFTHDLTKDNNYVRPLPKTNILGIDSLFEYWQMETKKNNIEFYLIINHSIHYLIEKFIPEGKLITLIGDHIKDAIIAINSSSNSYPSIMVSLGIVDNCYQFSVYDTGVEFEIDTLLKLGLETITTHKDTGGTGLGFMTTFETLRDCKASLIIEEKEPNSTYAKGVIIRFDNNNQYVIRSYRASEIREKSGDDRIIIEN